MSRPCRFCLAAYPILFEDGETTACEWEHRDEERIYVLARKMASVFQQPGPTDEQVAWFLADADAVIDDFASTVSLSSDARRAAILAAEGASRAEALNALHDVRFLVEAETPEGEK